MKILGIGLSGLVGSRIEELLKDKYQFEDLSLTTGVDITDSEKTLSLVTSSNASLVLHLAAKTDVNGCEEDKKEDIKILGYKDIGKQEEEFKIKKTAWAVNVLGTKNIVEACIKSGKKLIYISTDFVFDGKKEKPYIEKDSPNPVNWYGRTKYEGEKLVAKSNLPWMILRIAYPYRANFPRRDFVRVLIDKLENREKLKLVTDHIMTPTFVDDLSTVLDKIIESDLTGVFHAVGSQFVSPLEAGVIISNFFDFDKNLLQQTTREEFFKNRALRPFNLALKNDKIQKLGIKMKTFEEGLGEIKKQLT
ncbi:MAG: hypothetical protein A2629_01795 [Candidatus Levybacteria bacterium RIFCSPHIGHO2_01_FULL_41_15]|nr:MAG: hypothetical protein A2629_01795 [Candidatus Levybacteria bacterium RIFCSPHIGHO2_01_FULL_41_15]